MKLTSDPRAAARLRHGYYTYLGLSMLAGSTRAYTNHVCVWIVVSCPAPQEMKGAESEDGKR